MTAAERLDRITKADAAALWHAVEWMALCLRQGDPMTEAGILTERERLKAARKALRKVQVIARAAALPQPPKEAE